MRFLADESCDFAVIHALRAEGYDVLSVSGVIGTILVFGKIGPSMILTCQGEKRSPEIHAL